MSSDPLFILAYKIDPQEFDLCRGQSSISIRDQAVRARTLLRSLEAAEELQQDGRKHSILVVGAGYAGVCAALWLAKREHPVTLIDAHNAPFSMQAKCRSRWVSLTQYDWPALHYCVHDYPQRLSPRYFGYEWLNDGSSSSEVANVIPTKGIKRANEHAKAWNKAFLALLTKHPSLTWRPNTTFNNRDKDSTPIKVYLEEEREDKSVKPCEEDFDMVFHATGFGDGRVLLGNKGSGGSAKGFWVDDVLAEPGVAPPARVLVSGGGDGAIQDVIRSLVNPDFKTPYQILNHIYDRLIASRSTKETKVTLERDWHRMEMSIANAEAQASMAYGWLGKDHDPIWKELDSRYSLALSVFANRYGKRLYAIMESVLDRPMATKQLYHVHSAEFMKKCYPLNRFVYKLCVATERARGRNTFFGAQVKGRVRGDKTDLLIKSGYRLKLGDSRQLPDNNGYEAVITNVRTGEDRTIPVDELLVRNGVSDPGTKVELEKGSIRLKLTRFTLPYAAIS